MKVRHLMLLLALVSFAGYPKLADAKVNLAAYGIGPYRIGPAVSLGSSLSSSSVSLGKKKAFSYGDIYLEPDDGLFFSLEEMVDDINGYEVLSEYLPDGIEVTWTGRKFKVPKAGRVKYSKKEGDFVATSDDNPCGLTISISKKGKVSGSFKVYVAKSGTKVKSYTAKISGYLGGDLSVSMKKAGVYTAASLE